MYLQIISSEEEDSEEFDDVDLDHLTKEDIDKMLEEADKKEVLLNLCI